MKARNKAEIFFFSSFFLLLVSTLPLAQSFTENDEEKEEIQRNQFPDGFFFGTATSAYQALIIQSFFFILYASFFSLYFPHNIARYFWSSFFGCIYIIYLQIEGAYLEDGKSLSSWDVFSHIPG